MERKLITYPSSLADATSKTFCFLDELEHSLKVTKPAWVLTLPALLGTVVEAKKNAGSKIKVSLSIYHLEPSKVSRRDYV